MKFTGLVSAALFLISSNALAGFPFAFGTYQGVAVCSSEDGYSDSTPMTLVISENALETIYRGSEGDEHFVLSAKFDESGLFELSGAGVVSGQGYCSASRHFCHYDAVLRVQGMDIPGEDSMFIQDGVLRRMGSAMVNGTRMLCDETFTLQ